MGVGGKPILLILETFSRLLGNDTQACVPFLLLSLLALLDAAISIGLISSAASISPGNSVFCSLYLKLNFPIAIFWQPHPGCCQHHTIHYSFFPRGWTQPLSACFSWHEFDKLNAMSSVWMCIYALKEARLAVLENEAFCSFAEWGEDKELFPHTRLKALEKIYLPTLRCSQCQSLCC